MSVIDLQEEMRQSIQNNFGGFSLCYQPQMDGQTYQLLGAEALLRYHSPSRGMVAPTELCADFGAIRADLSSGAMGHGNRFASMQTMAGGNPTLSY